MLSAMIGLLALTRRPTSGVRSQPPRPGPREPAVAPPARRPDPPDPQANPAGWARHAGLDPRSPSLPRLAPAPRRGPARDRRRLAPPGLAPVLVVALPLPDGRPRLSAEVRD